MTNLHLRTTSRFTKSIYTNHASLIVISVLGWSLRIELRFQTGVQDGDPARQVAAAA